jgi:type IV pilus assembly protein PilW
MNKKGVTLIELLVVIAILAVVLAAVFKSYMMILKPQAQQQGIAQTNISNLIGIEILRKDIEMAGFGLPQDMNGNTCSEAVNDITFTPNPSDLNYNVLSDGDIPPAFTLLDNKSTNADNSDALAIRSSVAALSNASSNWGYIYNDGSDSEYNALGGDNSSIDTVHFSILDPTNKLKLIDGDCQYGSFPNPGNKIYMAFGIASSALRMPYNRVDYYLYKPDSGMPKRCAPGSYELYRAVINQSDGKRNPQPLIDCVKNFQIVLGAYNSNTNTVKWYNSTSESGLTPKILKDNLKQVKVYILYQEGNKDNSYISPSEISDNSTDNMTMSFQISGDDLHYRWKLLRLVVNPLNINIRERKLE